VRRLALVLAVAALGVSGCGGSSGDPLANAVDAARMTLGLPGVVYDLQLERQRLVRGPLRGRAAYDLRSGLGFERLTLKTRRLFLDFLPGAFYVAPDPAPPGLLPAGKPWISAPLVAGDPLAAQAEGLSPELALSEVAWGGEHAEHVGTRVVGHVPLDAYRVTVSLPKALAAARQAKRPALAAAIESELLSSGARRIPVTVWVNGPGYVARVERKVPRSALGTTTFTVTDFAARFNRAWPDPAQLVPLVALAHPERSLWARAAGS
jgi:hypothetical protein